MRSNINNCLILHTPLAFSYVYFDDADTPIEVYATDDPVCLLDVAVHAL